MYYKPTIYNSNNSIGYNYVPEAYIDNLIEDDKEKLKEQLEIKHTLQDYGVTEEQFWATLDEMSENAFNDQCTSTNPRYPLIEELKTIYIRSFYGNEYESRFPDREKIF